MSADDSLGRRVWAFLVALTVFLVVSIAPIPAPLEGLVAWQKLKDLFRCPPTR